jgi:hypothetical protein
MGEWDLGGEEESSRDGSDFSPTMESIENPSFPFPLDEDKRLCGDFAERVAERIECGGLTTMEAWGMG